MNFVQDFDRITLHNKLFKKKVKPDIIPVEKTRIPNDKKHRLMKAVAFAMINHKRMVVYKLGKEFTAYYGNDIQYITGTYSSLKALHKALDSIGLDRPFHPITNSKVPTISASDREKINQLLDFKYVNHGIDVKQVKRVCHPAEALRPRHLR